MIQPVFFPFSVAELLHFGYFFAPKLAGANPEPALDQARAHTPFLAENPGFPNPKVPRGNPNQFRKEGKYKGGSCEASSELRSKKARTALPNLVLSSITVARQLSSTEPTFLATSKGSGGSRGLQA